MLDQIRLHKCVTPVTVMKNTSDEKIIIFTFYDKTSKPWIYRSIMVYKNKNLGRFTGGVSKIYMLKALVHRWRKISMKNSNHKGLHS